MHVAQISPWLLWYCEANLSWMQSSKPDASTRDFFPLSFCISEFNLWFLIDVCLPSWTLDSCKVNTGYIMSATNYILWIKNEQSLFSKCSLLMRCAEWTF